MDGRQYVSVPECVGGQGVGWGWGLGEGERGWQYWGGGISRDVSVGGGRGGYGKGQRFVILCIRDYFYFNYKAISDYKF